MKSNFSRFLHHILPHSNEKPQSIPLLSYSGLTRISRLKKFATWFDLDNPIKSECDTMGTDATTCRGRSMVEMLGVLAIVGVLSVGAIAGYGKAMEKYRLNQYSQAISMLINNVLQIKGQLQHKPDTSTYFNTLLYKLNLLPDGIIYSENSEYLHDRWFKNNILVFYNNGKYTGADGKTYQNDIGFIRFDFSRNSQQGSEVCHTAITAIKENAGNIEYLQLLQYSDSDNTSEYSGWILPNDLRRINLNKIDKLCNQCTNYETCVLLVAWK